MRTFTPAQALSVGVERPGEKRKRWLLIPALAVIALLSVRACMPASAEHAQPPAREATLDVREPSPASATAVHDTPPSALVTSTSIPENVDEVAAVPALADNPNGTDSAVAPKKPGPDPRALAAKRAAKQPAASEAPAPAQNVVPYDKATLAQALSAAVQKAEQCDLWGRVTGTAKLFVTFAPTGKVTDARLEGEPLESAAVARCILHHARGASLPPFQGPEFTISRKITLR